MPTPSAAQANRFSNIRLIKAAMAVRIIRINDIVEEVLAHHPGADVSLIQKAYILSAQAHEGQTRLSGEPYLSHPLEVAYIMAQMGLDPVSVVCGLLHDTVEDTNTTIDDLDELFGEEVADIINGVTKISQISFDKKIDQQAEYIRKMILAMAHDITGHPGKTGRPGPQHANLGLYETGKSKTGGQGNPGYFCSSGRSPGYGPSQS